MNSKSFTFISIRKEKKIHNNVLIKSNKLPNVGEPEKTDLTDTRVGYVQCVLKFFLCVIISTYIFNCQRE